nr:actin cytoskeleton-regulatory complex protein PAN1-like isoform X15 [Onthophagus taurus]
MMGTMSSIKEIMQFCRLCLVKDQVNVSIFEEHGDTRDVKRKISECLPVTVSEEDSLPKKICDGCLYKLELLYQFRTTCVSAEKQLQVWIAELNNSESKEDQDLKLQHSQTSVKEEIFDATDHPDNSEYVIEEQHISYEEGDIPYNESQDDNDDGDATNSSDDEPLAKRRKRFLEEQVQTDDTLKTADNKMAITKLEHESDDENVDDPEPNFVSVGTSDDQQPGPSGLNKMSATTTNAEMPPKKINHSLQQTQHRIYVTTSNCNNQPLILLNNESERKYTVNIRNAKERLKRKREELSRKLIKLKPNMICFSKRFPNCKTYDATTFKNKRDFRSQTEFPMRLFQDLDNSHLSKSPDDEIKVTYNDIAFDMCELSDDTADSQFKSDIIEILDSDSDTEDNKMGITESLSVNHKERKSNNPGCIMRKYIKPAMLK